MKIKILGALALGISAVACTGTIHVASVAEAYKHYEKSEYDKTVELISMAESTGKMTDSQKVQLIYLKALAYEKLGEDDVASSLFAYITQQHAGSQYAYLAQARLVRPSLSPEQK